MQQLQPQQKLKNQIKLVNHRNKQFQTRTRNVHHFGQQQKQITIVQNHKQMSYKQMKTEEGKLSSQPILKNYKKFRALKMKSSELKTVKQQKQINIQDIGKIKKNFVKRFGTEGEKQEENQSDYFIINENSIEKSSRVIKGNSEKDLQLEEVHYRLVEEQQRLKKINFEVN